MKVIAWNMQHRSQGWEWLARQEADVALLNEAQHRPELGGWWPPSGVHGDGWRSAVLTTGQAEGLDVATPAYRGRPKSEVQVFGSLLPRPGAVAAAVVELPDRERVVAVAAYGTLGELADTSMHRIISDLADVVDDPSLPDLVLIGGDFNVTTQWSGTDAPYRERDRTVLTRLEALGFVDCVDRAQPDRAPLADCPCGDGSCRHVRTRGGSSVKKPWQNDYLFASAPLAERLLSAEVLATDELFALSDHAPIVATFAS